MVRTEKSLWIGNETNDVNWKVTMNREWTTAGNEPI